MAREKTFTLFQNDIEKKNYHAQLWLIAVIDATAVYGRTQTLSIGESLGDYARRDESRIKVRINYSPPFDKLQTNIVSRAGETFYTDTAETACRCKFVRALQKLGPDFRKTANGRRTWDETLRLQIGKTSR